MRVPDLIKGNNLEVLKTIPNDFVDLAYLDPPFFTGKNQNLFDRTLYNGNVLLSFKDIWSNHEEYLEWIRLRLYEVRRVLKPTGSIFLHCDWHASHLLRVLMDEVFYPEKYRGEIIWYYKRWTNTLRAFQHAHQIIYFYSKTNNYKFTPLYENYSLTTNIDQIWQKRGRDDNGKCVTMIKDNGDYVALGEKKLGVPMRDVWEIPYLNPKSKERTGWPTQKPLELLRRIILATTEEGDIVLDPVCGSGTTLVAAKALGRQWIGIDSSEEAIEISKKRLASKANPFSKNNHYMPFRLSRFIDLPRAEKVQHIADIIGMNIVHRNTNIDGFLKNTFAGSNIAVRFIDNGEPLERIQKFVNASRKKQCKVGIVILPKAEENEKEKIKNLYVFSYLASTSTSGSC